ncbi:acyl-CoA synthetase [Cryptosporidium ryanae]|uniref:acyl-CoA synthetase n=1 Tax=Cryptosporidium ryanae TaxID=515981 RepID=UPI00351A7791|nr:acyl-CoA synthetase [Cryptosporidium ryanae]
MGNVNSELLSADTDEYVYSYPIPGTGGANSTDIRRCKNSINAELVSNFKNKVENCWEMLLHGKEVSNDGDFLGYRVKDDVGTLGEYSFVKFSYVISRAKEIGSGLINLIGHNTESYDYSDLKLRCVAIFSKNTINWSITEHACNAYDFTTIPLYDVLGNSGLIYILNMTKTKAVFCSLVCAKKLLPLLSEIDSVKLLVMLDNDSSSLESIPECVKDKVEIINFDELRNIGKKNMKKVSPGKLDSIHSIHYTSGTTGIPKGVILPNKSWIACCSGFLEGGQLGRKDTGLSSSDCHISYLPLAHIFERTVHLVFSYIGGKIGFYSGDPQNLVNDIQKLKPTIFVAVPRVLSRIHDNIMLNLGKKSKPVQALFRFAMRQKERRNLSVHPIWDLLVFNKIKEVMGGRLRVILCGAAPLDKAILARIRCFTCAYCIEGYGMTELLPTLMPEMTDAAVQTLGGPSPSLEFKLVSIPEMGYDARHETPTGELLLRGPPTFIGYFGNPEETNAVICEGGWVKTGDICQLLPNGGLRIIDRRKNIFKLSQGEYVAPEKLENIFTTACELISHALVVGRSTENSLVAIFVLDQDFAMNFARNQQLGDDIKFSDLENHPAVINKIQSDLLAAEKQNNVLGYEKIRAFRCITTPFTVENELLTPTFKVVRYKAIKRFEGIIDELYKSIK